MIGMYINAFEASEKRESWVFSDMLLRYGSKVPVLASCVYAANNMARQPEVQGRLFAVFILIAAFIEVPTLIGLLYLDVLSKHCL